MTSSKKKAIKLINKFGILLVFPVNNSTDPKSLWSQLYPNTQMKWEWDEGGDQKVFKMWNLMKELSSCQEVVYSKWYRGRATFFSRDLFTAFLALKIQRKWSHKESRQILDELKANSPLSTKDLKKITGLKGKLLESLYNKAMKELFENFDIVGFGEVEDGAFPSLAVGASEVLYEDLFNEAKNISKEKAEIVIEQHMKNSSLLRKFYKKTRDK
ncbi:MAG: hypothetical protein HUU56_16250 [Bdellovibrionaceae bacterium]|nr:hypothetical protein [Pseudobdellovibrionaceae bacterium]